jgi:hypothetical protein
LNHFEEWSKAHNPFFEGANSDLLGLIPLVILAVLLYMVGREMLLASRPAAASAETPPPPPSSYER